MKAARLIHTGDRNLDDVQKNGRDATQRLNGMIFDGGKLLDAESGKPTGTGLAFTAGTARSLAHGLGRKARGFIEVYGPDAPSAAHVGLYATANPSPLTSATHITVTPTNTGTCQVFVY